MLFGNTDAHYVEVFPPGPLLKSISDLDDPKIQTETLRRVCTARIVFVNYNLLQNDFPELREEVLACRHAELRHLRGNQITRTVERIIERWLLQRAAFISEQQASQQLVNSCVLTSSERVIAFRPVAYGRAVVVPKALPGSGELVGAGEQMGAGLIDIKGVGVAPNVIPSFDLHGNGLLSLGHALVNVLYQKIINLIFRKAHTEIWALPEYGLIDLGFDIKSLDGGVAPAALQIRRAHRRPQGGMELPALGSPEQQVKLEIEILLRHYGITSCNDATSIDAVDRDGKIILSYGGQPVTLYSEEQLKTIQSMIGFGSAPMRFEGINVQLTRETSIDPTRAQVVDFGHYSVKERFEYPIVSLVRDRLLRWGGSIATDSPHFVQPHKRLALDYNFWGKPVTKGAIMGMPDGPFEAPPQVSICCFDLALRFRRRQMSGRAVCSALDEIAQSVLTKW